MFGTVRPARRRLDAAYETKPAWLHQGLEAMKARQRELGNLYAGEPIRSLPDPLLLDPKKWRSVVGKVKRLRRLMEAEATRLVAAGDFAARFGMGDLHRDLVLASAARPGRPAPVARFDGMLTPRGGFQIVEVNTDGSTGVHDGFSLGEAARQAPALRDLATRYRLRPLDLYRPLAACLRALAAAGGVSGLPRVAIVDWAEVKSAYEQRALAAQLTALGVPTDWCDPRELRRTNGRLRGPGGAIDIVYKRVLTSELIARAGEVRPYLDAVLKGQVLQLDPFTADLLYDKGLLAHLRSRETLARLTKPQAKLVRELVPEAHVFPGGERLMARALAEKDRWVLKPRAEYGGRGVYLGHKTSKRAWKAALEGAAAGGGHLLQAYVEPMRHEVWEPRARGRATKATRYGTLGVWLMGERTPGFYFRAGPDPVINVSSGAYGLPVLYATPRKR